MAARSRGPGSAAVGHSDVAPGPSVGSSPGTFMRKSLPERGWAGPRGHGWQVPSESVGVGGLAWSHGMIVGSGCPRVSTPTAASGLPAQPRVQPGCPSTFAAPLGGLWATIPGGDFQAIARAAGYPGDPAAAPRLSPRCCGPRARWSGGRLTWGLGAAGCRRPFLGD